MVTLSFQITSEAYELLMQIKRETAVEYRDTNYQTLEDFKKSGELEHRTEEWFLKRNNNGTLYLIYELERCGLVECDGESWHMTYILTEFGKEVTDMILS